MAFQGTLSRSIKSYYLYITWTYGQRALICPFMWLWTSGVLGPSS